MHKVKINLKKRSYEIFIGQGLLSRAGGLIRKIIPADSLSYIITNPTIKNKHGMALKNSLEKSGFRTHFALIPESEKAKSIAVAAKILQDIPRRSRKNSVFIIAFGGGVTGDLAGFVASIYKRGIPYIQIPTTLLAQVDSSIGGKTGVDLPQAKNLAGAIYQPRMVISDISALKTLPLRQLKSGLAEVIKYAAIKDPGLFSFLEKNYKALLRRNVFALEYIVSRCSAIKGKIVETDEFEKRGIRTALNFGHTIGHAIEAAAGYGRYNHGEAIAVGMCAAADIGKKLGITPPKAASRLEALIKTAGLPVRVKGLKTSRILRAHYHDKKFTGPKNRFVLISGIGKVRTTEGIPQAIIQKALRDRS